MDIEKQEAKEAGGLAFLIGVLFIITQSLSVFGGDGGDLVSAICTKGVAHPPGYPLYTFLGRLLFFLPFFTPAWRVSLISSIPGALTVALVFILVTRLTKNKTAGILSALTLAFSYLFWLYSSVPEVFSLNNLFLTLLTLITFSLLEKFEEKKLRWWFFIAGLSLSHHHFSLWFYPVFVTAVYFSNRKYWNKNFFKKILSYLPFFLLGLIPYIYVPLAAKNWPVINWNGVTNLNNFFKLVTRAAYGSFISHGGSLEVGLNERLFLALGYFFSLFEYFGWVGFLLFILGGIFFWRLNKKIFYFFFALFLTEIAFLFYSGFKLSSAEAFSVGVYLRFLLPGLIFGVIFMGGGIVFLNRFLVDFFKERLHFSVFSKKTLSLLLFLPFAIFPITLFAKNFPRILSLRNDFRAENLGRDILETLPPKSILILANDTPLFNTQYVRYCLKEREDVFLLHLSLMNQDFYRRVIEKNFPQLELPEDKDNFFKNFVALNSPKFPIYTNDFSQWEEGYFSPEGLLYRYYSSAQEIPSVKEIYQKNNLIWEKYHDPLKENSYGFEPVTLSAVRRNYYYSAMKLAQLFTEAKHWDEAIFYWEKAIYFEPKDLNLRLNLGEVYTKKGDCQRAEETLKKALADFSSPLPYLYLKENAAECWHDNVKKEEYEKLYQEKTKKPSKDYSR